MDLQNPFEVDDERGVSPVIGVILMVAITVILAAVIGAFVLDLGSQLGSTGPQTQLSVTDAEESLSADGNTSDVVVIEHKGGDTLKTEELKVIVTNGSSTWTADPLTSGFDSTLTNSSTGAEFSVGETITIREAGTNIAAGEYTVKVIHRPSNSVVTSTKVEVN